MGAALALSRAAWMWLANFASGLNPKAARLKARAASTQQHAWKGQPWRLLLPLVRLRNGQREHACAKRRGAEEEERGEVAVGAILDDADHGRTDEARRVLGQN